MDLSNPLSMCDSYVCMRRTYNSLSTPSLAIFHYVSLSPCHNLCHFVTYKQYVHIQDYLVRRIWVQFLPCCCGVIGNILECKSRDPGFDSWWWDHSNQTFLIWVGRKVDSGHAGVCCTWNDLMSCWCWLHCVGIGHLPVADVMHVTSLLHIAIAMCIVEDI